MPRRLVAALLLSSVLGGCGYSLTGPAPNRQRHVVPECDTSKSLVVIDGLLATALGIATLSLVSSAEPAVALLPLSLGAIYLGGAVKGNAAVNKCREARSEFDDAEAARETLAGDEEGAGRTRTPLRRPSDVVPQLPYTPTPYPGPGTPGQPAYSPTNPPTPPTQYTAPTQAPAPPPAAAQPPVAARPPAAPTAGAPPPQPQPPRPAPPRAQSRPQPADDTDWSDFWREVP